MTEQPLNENDKRLLAFCFNKPQSINKIAQHLKVSPASVSVKVGKLSKKSLIDVKRKGHGKMTLVRTKEGVKVMDYMKELLRAIKEKGGKIEEKEFFSYFVGEDYLGDVLSGEQYDKSMAQWAVLYSPYVKRIVEITPEGAALMKKK